MTLPDSTAERAREGAKVRREVLGAAYVDAGKQQANPFTQHFIEFTQTQCWGNVWLREGLSPQDPQHAQCLHAGGVGALA